MSDNTNEQLQAEIQSAAISVFRKRVFLALLQVPKGETISYAELGRRIDCNSPQAVGQALQHNLFAPEVPCHRVICSDGSIGGFHGERAGEQIVRKRQLLRDEGVII